MSSFLEGRLGFTHIPQVIAQAMDAHAPEPAATLADVRRVDAWARMHAAELAQELELKTVTTLLSFLVRARRARLHPRARPFPARAVERRPRASRSRLASARSCLKVQRGDTEYCISAMPLGGYVKMAGENPDDPQTGADDEFLAKSKWQRFQILIAGPAMNILLAVVLLAAVLMRGADVPRVSRSAGRGRPGAAGITGGESRPPAGRSNHPVRHRRRAHVGTPRDGGGRRGRSAKSTSRSFAAAAKSTSRCAPI